MLTTTDFEELRDGLERPTGVLNEHAAICRTVATQIAAMDSRHMAAADLAAMVASAGKLLGTAAETLGAAAQAMGGASLVIEAEIADREGREPNGFRVSQ